MRLYFLEKKTWGLNSSQPEYRKKKQKTFIFIDAWFGECSQNNQKLFKTPKKDWPKRCVDNKLIESRSSDFDSNQEELMSLLSYWDSFSREDTLKRWSRWQFGNSAISSLNLSCDSGGRKRAGCRTCVFSRGSRAVLTISVAVVFLKVRFVAVLQRHFHSFPSPVSSSPSSST